MNPEEMQPIQDPNMPQQGGETAEQQLIAFLQELDERISALEQKAGMTEKVEME